MGEHDFMKGVDYNNLSPELINQTMVKPRTESSKPTYEAEKPHETYKPRTFVDHAKQIQSAKPISSDEEESEFSPVESQRPSYELPERRQKSKLLYYEPSEQEEKIKNKPLLKDETPDWEKHKQKDEKSPDPKQNIQIGKGRGSGKGKPAALKPDLDYVLAEKPTSHPLVRDDLHPDEHDFMKGVDYNNLSPELINQTMVKPRTESSKPTYEAEKPHETYKPRTFVDHAKQIQSAKPISSDEE